MPADHSPAATPARLPAGGRIGWLRGAIGAGVAMVLVGLITAAALRGDPALPWLLAPMGASAVLIFCVPASPMAQPWPVAGGHVISALAGMAAHALPVAPWAAAGIGLATAIAAMSAARCLHPAGGGTVLITALPTPAIAAAGWHFLALPLALNLAVLLAVGWGWNRLAGHSYPHRAAPAAPPLPAGFSDADLDAVLADWDEALDVSREDLRALLRAVEARALSGAARR